MSTVYPPFSIALTHHRVYGEQTNYIPIRLTMANNDNPKINRLKLEKSKRSSENWLDQSSLRQWRRPNGLHHSIDTQSLILKPLNNGNGVGNGVLVTPGYHLLMGDISQVYRWTFFIFHISVNYTHI